MRPPRPGHGPRAGLPVRPGGCHGGLIIAARFSGDLDDALQLARQATQIPDIPGRATRACGRLLAGVLAEAGT